jgi:DNA-binding CsgD family transcriptional regulator
VSPPFVRPCRRSPRRRCELSRREAQIAAHVERGLTTTQIALIVGTSPLTVRNRIGHIFDKTGVASRAEEGGDLLRRAANEVAQCRVRHGWSLFDVRHEFQADAP